MPRKAAGAGAVKDAKSEPGVAAKATKAKGKGAAVGKGQAATKATPVNPADKVAELKELEERRRQMKEQLLQVEAQIYTLESQYLEKANPRGNALKGYEGLLTSVAGTVKKGAPKAEDRIFSGSSVTGRPK
mmetsp:Transcript_10152/g.30626  ORF Transcript_10152/g.30626 Transcript_10152/m.30626 type:complete len:131 (-) Transcript_10152:297-689(-)